MNNQGSTSESDSPWSYPRSETQSQAVAGHAKDRIKRFELAIGSPEPGEMLAKRFTIKERIAEGGMSLIYKAYDHTRQHLVALKFLSPAMLQEPAAIRAFKQEAKISMLISHPNILRVFDVQEYQGSHFLVMEFLEGGTLRQWVNKSKKLAPSMEERCRILLAICKGLECAHQTTAHCDLKPENIGITDLGEVKIMDFGLARLTSRIHSSLFRESVTQLNGGTPYYMAPELLSAQNQGDPRSDQFSFGVIAYELIVGELPIGLSRPLADRVTSLSSRFTQSIDRCLSPNPSQRFPDIQALLNELELGLSEKASWTLRFKDFWRNRHPVTKTALVASTTAVLLCIPANHWIQFNKTRQSKVEAAWVQLDEHKQEAAKLAQRVEEKRRSRMFMELAYERESKVTPRTMEERISLLNLERDLRHAEEVWSWIEPQLTSNGMFISLDQRLIDCRNLLTAKQLEDYQDNQAKLSEHIDKLGSELDLISRLEHLRYRITQRFKELDSMDLDSEIIETWHNEHSRASQAYENQKWSEAFLAWDKLNNQTQSQLDILYQAARKDYEQQNNRWNACFPNLGSPNLAFLSDTHSHASDALVLYTEQYLIQAIHLLNETSNTLRHWADEVTRHQHALDKAIMPGTEYIEGLGMRFAKIGGIYWGVTEVRVMDFARWVEERMEISPITAKHWINPGFTQGPTDSAVWITRQDALNFASWVGSKLLQHDRPTGKIPRLMDWEILLNTGDIKGSIPRAIYPDENQWRSNKFRDDYEDKRIQPGTYLGPTDRGSPSINGLFGLDNGVWEWCDSYYDYSRGSFWASDPLKGMLTCGGNFGITTFNTIDPPRTEDIDFVLRKDAVGMRVILIPRTNP